MNRYEERLAQLKHPDVHPGDVVLVNGGKEASNRSSWWPC